MVRHTFEPTRFHVTIGEHEPVLHVADGDSITTWCVDATGRDARDEQITRAENDEFVMAVGNARPLDQAVQHATTELLRLLEDVYGLDYRASSVLLGQLNRYDVGNDFDPAYSMVAKVAKRHLAERVSEH
jgi:acetamidase/formamidase